MFPKSSSRPNTASSFFDTGPPPATNPTPHARAPPKEASTTFHSNHSVSSVPSVGSSSVVSASELFGGPPPSERVMNTSAVSATLTVPGSVSVPPASQSRHTPAAPPSCTSNASSSSFFDPTPCTTAADLFGAPPSQTPLHSSAAPLFSQSQPSQPQQHGPLEPQHSPSNELESESPAIATAVNLFSNAASALFQTASVTATTASTLQERARVLRSEVRDIVAPPVSGTLKFHDDENENVDTTKKEHGNRGTEEKEEAKEEDCHIVSTATLDPHRQTRTESVKDETGKPPSATQVHTNASEVKINPSTVTKPPSSPQETNTSSQQATTQSLTLPKRRRTPRKPNTPTTTSSSRRNHLQTLTTTLPTKKPLPLPSKLPKLPRTSFGYTLQQSSTLLPPAPKSGGGEGASLSSVGSSVYSRSAATTSSGLFRIPPPVQISTQGGYFGGVGSTPRSVRRVLGGDGGGVSPLARGGVGRGFGVDGSGVGGVGGGDVTTGGGAATATIGDTTTTTAVNAAPAPATSNTIGDAATTTAVHAAPAPATTDDKVVIPNNKQSETIETTPAEPMQNDHPNAANESVTQEKEPVSNQVPKTSAEIHPVSFKKGSEGDIPSTDSTVMKHDSESTNQIVSGLSNEEMEKDADAPTDNNVDGNAAETDNCILTSNDTGVEEQASLPNPSASTTTTSLAESTPTSHTNQQRVEEETTFSSAPPSSPPLPPGWSELIAPDTGMKYYLNEVTGVTTWERPLPTANNGQPLPFPEPATVEKDTDAPAHPEPLADGTTERNGSEPFVPETFVQNAEHSSPENTVAVNANAHDATLANTDLSVAPEVTPDATVSPEMMQVSDDVVPDGAGDARTGNGLPPIEDDYVHVAEDTAGGAVMEVCQEGGVDPVADVSSQGTGDVVNNVAPANAPVDSSVDTTHVITERSTEGEEGANLAQGWVEFIDSSSGLPYYYNEETKLTSWEKPTNATSGSSDGVSDGVRSSEALEGGSEELVGGNNTVNVPEQAGDASEVDVVQPLEGSDEATTEAGCPLPTGWVELTDPSSGRTYYFNELENISCWERPGMDQESREIEQMDGEEGEEEYHGGEFSPEMNKNGSGATGSSSSEDHVTSNNIQYEEEKQPEDIQEPVSVLEDDRNMDEDVVVDEKSGDTPKSDTLLPPGWIEVIDQSSGLPYYYNEVEGITSWDKPLSNNVAESTRDEPNEMESTRSDAEDIKKDEGGDIGGLNVSGPGIGETTDDTSSFITEKHDELNSLKGDNKLEESEQIGDTKVTDTKNDLKGESELPSGWVLLRAPTTDMPYYYNEATGVTSWEKPTFGETAEDNTNTPNDTTSVSDLPGRNEMPEDTLDSTGVTRNSDFEISASDTVEDKAKVDDCQETPLEYGISGAVEEIKDSDKVDEDTMDLPAGWVQLKDPSSGLPYYFNETEGVTSWEKPSLGELSVLDTTEEPVTAISSNENGVSNTSNSFEENPEEVSSLSDKVNQSSADFGLGVSSTEVTKPEESQELLEETGDEMVEEEVEDNTKDHENRIGLPNGWVELKDPASALPYFYNEVTGETSWERPSLNKSAIISETEEKSVAEGANNGNGTEMPAAFTSEETSEDFSNAIPLMNKSDDGLDYGISTVADSEKVKESVSVIDEDRNEEMAEKDLSKEISTTELPFGWTKLVHPESGFPYYFNEATGATSWDKPCMEEPIVQGVGKDQIKENSDTDKCVSNLSDAPIEQEVVGDISCADKTDKTSEDLQADVMKEESSKAGEGFSSNSVLSASGEKAEESFNPIDETSKSGNYLDYDEMKEEAFKAEQLSIMNDSKFEEVNNEGEVVAKENADAVESSADWVELIDATSGKPYYYNETTGATSWTKPPMEAPIVDSAEEEQLVDTTSTSEISHGAKSIIENVPKVEDNHDTMDEAIVGGVEDESNLNANDDKTNNELPVGWVQLVDPSSGFPYYYNETTGSTSWEKPALNDSNSANTKQDPTLERDGNGNGDSNISHLPVSDKYSDTSNTVDEPSKECVVSAADGGLKESIKAGESIESSEKTKFEGEEKRKDIVNGKLDGKELSIGWIELKDPASGMPYYYNETTGESSWDKPTVEQPVVSAENDELNLESTNTDTNSSDLLVVKEKSQDLTNVEEVTNELVSGHVAKVNSGESTSADSKQEATTVQTNDLTCDESNPSSSELPAGWAQLKHPTSGLPYYYNENTGETSWDKPSHTGTKSTMDADIDRKSFIPADSSVQSAEDTGSTEMLSESKGTRPNKTKNCAPLDQAEGMLPSILPPGWAEVIDPSSGMTYYFHESDGITSWERPCIETDEKSLPESSKPSFLDEPRAAKELISGKTLTSMSTNTSRQRPAHAIASFGFGGRLCVMMPQVATRLAFTKAPSSNEDTLRPSLRKGPVCVHRISKLVPNSEPPRTSETEGNTNAVVRPLNSCSDTEVLSHLNKKAGDGKSDTELLWSLIFIAARWKGRLRSAGGASDPRGPEAAIVNLLLRDHSKTTGNDQKLDTVCASQERKSNTEASTSLNEVQELLIRGKREEAVSCALSCGNYALALLIASMCDHSTYQDAASRFADEALPNGSPLHTVAKLFASQIQPSADSSGAVSEFWAGCNDNIDRTWRRHLATILSNQTRGWKKIVMSLGDQLLRLGYVDASHFCYMVSGCPITSYTDPSSRLVLVGCDHMISMHMALMTRESLESYERTEALEWAKRKGNPQAAISVLQPFKLKYAMLLADCGMEKEAKMYVDSIRKCSGLKSEQKNGNKSKKVAAALASYPKEFIRSLEVFEDRVCMSLGISPPISSEKKSISILPSVLPNIFKGNSKSKPASRQDKTEPSSLNPETSLATSESLPTPEKTFVSTTSEPSAMNTLGMNETFDTAASNLPNFTSQASQENQEMPMNKTLVPPSVDLSSKKTTSSSAPPTFHSFTTSDHSNAPTLRNQANHISGQNELQADSGFTSEEKKDSVLRSEPSTPIYPNSSVADSAITNSNIMKESENSANDQSLFSDHDANDAKMKIKQTPASFATPAPASAPVHNKKKEEAPSSGKKGFSLTSWIAGKLNPNATQADVGEAMEAYYDEKTKRWIFPGEDPAEVAKPLPPPPITPKPDSNKEAAISSTPVPPSNDPLASLMAPPTRPPSALRGAGLSHSAIKSRVNNPPGIGPPPSSKIPPLSPAVMKPPTGNVQETPKFAIFQPVPTKETTGTSSDKQPSS